MTIRFTTEHIVQITVGDCHLPPQTYEDLGFVNKKTKNPNLAWQMLQNLARLGGTLKLKPTGGKWAPDRVATQKRMQEIRKILREGFNTEVDPVPFKKGTGYKTAFKIESGSALD